MATPIATELPLSYTNALPGRCGFGLISFLLGRAIGQEIIVSAAHAPGINSPTTARLW
jgi:hypothetical protein